MEKLVGQLRRSTHMLRPDVASFVCSVEFKEAIAAADASEDTKAFLMVEALKGIALDPLTGEGPASFYTIHGDSAGFHIRLNRTSNFIGLIDLPADSGRAKQLTEAIEQNLASRMFKAAKMHRRLDKRRTRLHMLAHEKAWFARMEVLEYRTNPKPSKEKLDLAKAAYAMIYDPRMEAIDARIKRVSDASCPAFRGAYTSAVAEFLYRHLPVKSTAPVC